MTTLTYPERVQQYSVAKSARSSLRVRMICSQDRALIYNTIARLQAAGLAYLGCQTNSFLVIDAFDGNENINNAQSARVYLTSPAEIVSGLPRDELAARAEEWHWDALHCLFVQLDYNTKEAAHPIIRQATRSTRITKVTSLQLIKAPNSDDTEVLLLAPLSCIWRQIRIPAMPTMPLKLMLASALHSGLILDKNSLHSPWSVTVRSGDLKSHGYEEDRDGRRTPNLPLMLLAAFILPNCSVGIINTGILRKISFLRPSSTISSHVDRGREI